MLLAAITYAVLLVYIWNGRTEIRIQSAALGEERAVTVFNAGNEALVSAVYSLDGEGIRHGLLPATNGALIAWMNGKQAPIVIGVHAQGTRDIDLRPANVQPTDWRPNISGRGAMFDVFLIEELRQKIEKRFGTPKARFLFGHSLGGFYAIDMATRQYDHDFDGLYAFSPTFSHDISLKYRLDRACANSPLIYANIGLESKRDTAVFDGVEKRFGKSEICKRKLLMSRHFGMVHQIVMLSGQIAALRMIMR